MALPDHLFCASDGSLYDTRDNGWSIQRPLRTGYKGGFVQADVATLANVKAALRAGQWTDLGGYPLYFITQDGAALSFEAVRQQWREIVCAFMGDHYSDDWRIVSVAVNYEDGELHCDHTGARIPSAYAEPEES